MRTIKYNDSIEKDLQQKKLILEKQAPLTGNIFIDKPWTVNYPDKPKVVINIEETAYNTFSQTANEHLKDIAIVLPDSNEIYTYEELLSLIDRTASSLAQLGITKDSLIVGMLNSTIEEPIFFLAANKIGAKIKFVDYAKNMSEVLKSIEAQPVDLIVTDEMMLPMEPTLNKRKIQTIICGTHRIYDRGHYLSFYEMLKKYPEKEPIASEYEENKPKLIINSSGTTGTAKPIVHTDKSINASAQKMLFSNYPIEKGNVIMKIIPPQIGLGIITTLYTTLISGTPVVLVRGANIDDTITNSIYFIQHFKTFLEKYNLPKDTKLVLFASPMYYRAIINNPLIEDMSFMSGMLAAGSKMTKEELELLHMEAQKKNCQTPITNGYGQNEMGGAVALNDPMHNEDGSAGYPVIGTNIRIVDQITLEDVKPHEQGKILEQSESAFLSYGDSKELTQKAFITLPDGSVWFDTNDIGYMTETGFLYITGRTTRVIIRNDLKIPLETIEEKIKVAPFIEECGAIVTEQGSSQERMEVFITIKPEFAIDIDEKEAIKLIIEKELLSDFEIPDSIHLLPEMPHLSSGKIDYQTLLKTTKSYAAKLTKKQGN